MRRSSLENTGIQDLIATSKPPAEVWNITQIPIRVRTHNAPPDSQCILIISNSFGNYKYFLKKTTQMPTVSDLYQ